LLYHQNRCRHTEPFCPPFPPEFPVTSIAIMKHPLRLLLIEDSVDDAELLLATLDIGGYAVTHERVESAAGVQRALAAGNWDIVISDYTLPQFSGLEALHIVRLRDPDLPFIITSGNIGEDIAVEAMRRGAHDYLMKNNLARLLPAIARELREAGVRRTARHGQMLLEEGEARFRAIMSNLPGMVYELLVSDDGAIRITYASDGSQQLLGVSPAELIGNSEALFSRLSDHSASGLRDCLIESTRSGRAFNWEGHVDARPGSATEWVIARMSPLRLRDGRTQWHGVLQDISRRKQAELELLRSRQQLSALSSHLQEVKEAERASIAREVHDDIGGNLTAIKIDLLWLMNHVGKTDAEALTKLHSLEFLADRTMEISSRIARDLRPPLLDQGLLAAMEWEASDFEKRMEIPCVVRCDEEDIKLAPDLGSALFSVFRETLTNISKHARATRVDVGLRIDDTHCTLAVADNGRGFTQTDLLKEDSFGLRGMLERVRNLRGDIRFGGSPGAGATVVVSLPLHAAASNNPSENTSGSLWLEL
jgi:two-component system, NarL family, sensor histidine kinase UhpB